MKKKLTQSEIDGVQYRRAKTWRIILAQMNGGIGMCFYVLVGYASYVANQGYGIATAIVGLILTGTRIFDGITDPLIALLVDKTKTRFGKIRIWLCAGWALESLAIMMLYKWASNGTHGIVMFVALYMLYVVGYTMNNVTSQIIIPVMINDPNQRPMAGVWGTICMYITPMILMIGINTVILPQYGNEFSIPMLSAACNFCILLSFVFLVLTCIGVSNVDKPENFNAISVSSEEGKIGIRDMLSLLKSNRPLQCFVVSVTSDKLAQQTAGQAIITTMLYGILIGNMGISTLLNAVAMLPSIVFAIIGARYAGKHGNKKAVATWTGVCIGVTAIMVIFCSVIDMRKITVALIPTAIFFILTFAVNGARMCVSTANGAMMADVIDYELDRSGKYMPAAVTATYSFLDKLISSLGATIAAASVALIGYTTTVPQPTDAPTTSIKILTMILMYALPILGWLCTLFAMRFYHLTKSEMVNVQKRISEKKVAVKN